MSPRAAWRLEALGFTQVYDYTVGKADWLAAGLPTERTGSHARRVVEAMEDSVPTCGPGETVDQVAGRLDVAGAAVSTHPLSRLLNA
jgi:3-mercaptopyruvate sulfurtransferase SseA